MDLLKAAAALSRTSASLGASLRALVVEIRTDTGAQQCLRGFSALWVRGVQTVAVVWMVGSALRLATAVAPAAAGAIRQNAYTIIAPHECKGVTRGYCKRAAG